MSGNIVKVTRLRRKTGRDQRRGVHPGPVAQGVSAIRYDLHRQYSRFLCDVGFLDPASQQGAVEFSVYGGTNVKGRCSFQRRHARYKETGIRHVNIDVSDCDSIVLGVRSAGDGDDGNHVVLVIRDRRAGTCTGSQPPSPCPAASALCNIDHQCPT